MKNRRTSCAKFCIPYEEDKGLFRKTQLNKKLLKHCKIRTKNIEIRQLIKKDINMLPKTNNL